MLSWLPVTASHQSDVLVYLHQPSSKYHSNIGKFSGKAQNFVEKKKLFFKSSETSYTISSLQKNFSLFSQLKNFSLWGYFTGCWAHNPVIFSILYCKSASITEKVLKQSEKCMWKTWEKFARNSNNFNDERWNLQMT